MSKTVKKIIIALFVILVVFYVAGVFYFTEVSYPNTKVNGNDKGLVKLNDLLNVQNDDLELQIEGRENKSLKISGKDINLKANIVGKPEINQSQFLWPLEIFAKHEYNFDLKNEYDKNKLSKILDESDLFKKFTEPEDAKVIFKDDKVKIVEEVLGSKLDKAKVEESIIDAINNNKESIKLESEYQKPKIYSDDKELLKQKEKFEKISKFNYIFDFKDRNWNLKGEELLSFLDEKNGKYEFNTDKLHDYLVKMAVETDTYGESRKFKATGLGEITVPAGIYGWQMNVNKTMETVKDMFAKEQSGQVEIVYNLEGLERGKDDIGSLYVEIDISRQKLWMYKDGKVILETPVVTGDNRKVNSRTPVGVNKIWSKELDRDLKGIHPVSGNRYVYPVKYWMPIGWTGSGMHDTYNRDKYGGDIYKYNGSGSCINIPLEAVKKIYENAPINTPVIVYESSTSDSPTEFEKQEMIRKGEAEADVS